MGQSIRCPLCFPRIEAEIGDCCSKKQPVCLRGDISSEWYSLGPARIFWKIVEKIYPSYREEDPRQQILGIREKLQIGIDTPNQQEEF